MRAEMSTPMSASALPGNAGLRPASEAGETPAAKMRIGQEDGGRYELTERSGSLTDGRGYGVMRAWRTLRPHTDEQL